jgi:Uma2 family endonuclease
MSDKPIHAIQYQAGQVIEENISFEDFMARYEGQRVEYHMGKVIARMPNNKRHQELILFLTLLLSAYLGFRKIGKLFLDGYQMRLADDMPMRQPDLLVVLAEHYSRLEKTRVNGAADLVIEIISPTTGSDDRGDKFYEYQKGGVPEYWIIDPENEEVDIYILDEKGRYKKEKNSHEKIVSQKLTGFVLDIEILWQAQLPEFPEALELVQEMLKTDA